MKQLPTRRQLYWIVAIAVVFALFSGPGGAVATAGYVVGQVVAMALLVTVAKAVYFAGKSVSGHSEAE